MSENWEWPAYWVERAAERLCEALGCRYDLLPVRASYLERKSSTRIFTDKTEAIEIVRFILAELPVRQAHDAEATAAQPPERMTFRLKPWDAG